MSRAALIRFIRENDKFYAFVNFSEHTVGQLKAIKERIETDGPRKQGKIQRDI
jgi:hypothetical protein